MLLFMRIGDWRMPWWLFVVGLILQCLLWVAIYRYAWVKGKRDSKFKWRCWHCHILMVADTEQEILHGSIEHLKEHMDGPLSPPEEGS